MGRSQLFSVYRNASSQCFHKGLSGVRKAGGAAAAAGYSSEFPPVHFRLSL